MPRLARPINRADVSNRYIPKGARKVADRQSDAIVYLYERATSWACYAIGYSGKRAKPDWHHRFRDVASRERHVADYFDSRQRSAEFKIEQRKKQGKGRELFVGSILQTCWGYDQTNIEFFQVTALIGKTMVELRELAQARKSEGWCRDACAPVPDEFIGEPIRRKVSGYDGASVRIDDVRRAYRWDGSNAHATSYA